MISLIWLKSRGVMSLRRRIDEIERGQVEMVSGPQTLQIARERVVQRRARLL